MSIYVDSETPRIQFTVTSPTTAFAFDFNFFQDSDIKVYVDSTLKELTTHYTVTGEGNDTASNHGGTVTFGSAVDDVTVTIIRDITIQRTTDFPASGSFQVDSLNTELDTITAIQQELEDDFNRALRLDDEDSAVAMTLPLKASRIGKILGFNSSTGVPEMYVYLTNENTVALDGLTAGTVLASKYVLVDANKDIGTFRNITLSGELDAGSLDVSGDADIDGTLEADAITIGGVTLAETIADTVGAMVSSNTETGITVTYEDGDNTLDFVIGSGVIATAMLAGDAITEALIADDAVESEHINNNVISGQTEITSGLADADELLYSDGGTVKKVGMDTLKTYFSAVAGNSSITTVGTIGTGTWQGTAIASTYISSDSITGAKIADNAIDSEHYTDGSIDLAHMSANSIDSSQYVDGSIDLVHMSANSVDSDQYVDGSIDLVHMSANSIDSDQYVDGSIDTAHIANDQITNALMADDAIDSSQLASGSVDLAHMSANSIDSDQYVDGSIDTVHLSDGSITGAKIAAGTVVASDVADDAITTAKILNANVTLAKMAANSIDSTQYVDGSIDTAHYAAGSVDGTAIANDAIDSQHYAADSIDAEHYAAGSVDTTALGADSVTAAKIGDDVINSEHIAADSIDAEHLNANSVNTDAIIDDSVTSAHLAAGSVDATALGADCVTAAKIGDNVLNSEHYAAASIDNEHLAANSVDSDNYVDGSIDTIHIGADQITSAKIADDQIDSEHIVAGSVDAEHMSANSIDSASYVDGSIDLAHMSANSIDSDQYVDGSIDLVHLSANSVDSDQYVDGSIDTAHVSDNAVTLAKMAGLARGKLITGDASGDPSAFTVGTNGQYLKSDGNDLVWGSATISGLACDDLTVGDSAVTVSTSSGNITVDAQGNNTDIIFKGTDATADITMLTLDGGEAGDATFNRKVIATELDISGDIDVDGTANLDVVDIDGAVDMATTLAVAGNVDFNGALVVSGSLTTFDTNDIIKTDGFLKVSNAFAFHGSTDNYANVDGQQFHELNSGQGNDFIVMMKNTNAGTAQHGLIIDHAAGDTDNTSSTFIIGQNTAERFKVLGDGDCLNHDNTFSSISDERIKQDITDAKSQWDDIKSIKIRNYKKKDDVRDYGDKAKSQIGVVAQELETVSPYLVKENPPSKGDILSSSEFGTLYTSDDADVKNGIKVVGDIKEQKTTVKSVKYSILYMKAIKALQEAMTRIETLETKVKALEDA